MDALLHMLGLDADHRDDWRNHFVAGPGHHDNDELLALEASGLVERVTAPAFLPAGDTVWRATERGKCEARAENARRNPRPGPARARYLAWLRISDVCPDLTFGEYLRRRGYLEARA